MNVNVSTMRTAAEQGLAAAFAEQRSALPGADWVGRLREDAASHVEASGLPHRRVEEWKWTDLRAAMRTALPVASPVGEVRPAALPGLDETLLVFVNGRFAPGVSSTLPAGVAFQPLAQLLAGRREGLAARIGTLAQHGEAVPQALNTAFMSDGAVLTVAAGVKLEKPIRLAFVFSGDAPASVYARNLIVVGDGAEATIVESLEGPSGIAYETNVVTELFVGDGAALRHYGLQDEGGQALHLGTLLISLGADARLDTFAMNVGAGFTRRQLGLLFAGENSHASLSGVTLVNAKQHSDTTLLVDHAVPHCDSRERFKSALDGQSRGVFQGKIIVRKDAQKTDGKMMAQGLFLSDEAEFDGKPELEIFADDVVCGHGCTAGRLDDDQVFYLMARGISRNEAEALLVRAFVAEAIEAVEDDALREALEARADIWLAARKA